MKLPRSHTILAVLWSISLPGLLFWPFFTGKTLFYGDNYSLMVPGKLFVKEAILQGQMPYWNPYSFSGAPFLADINQSVFYPTTLLFLTLDPGLALSVSIWIHLSITIGGMYYFSRRLGNTFYASLIASLLWGFSQVMIAAANNLAAIQTTSFIPWIFASYIALIKSRDWFGQLFAGFVALALLGGHPQPLLYAGIGLLLFTWHFKSILWQRKLPLILLMIMALCLTLVVIVPTIELAPHTTRAKMTTNEVLHGSSHPLHLLQIVIPNIFSEPHLGLLWGPDWGRIRANNAFITLMAWWCIAYLIRRRGLNSLDYRMLAIGVGATLLSLGHYLPGLPWLVDHLSALRLFRGFSGIDLMLPLMVAPVAGKAIAYYSQTKASKRLVLAWFGVWLMAMIGSVLFLRHFSYWWQFIDERLHSFLSTSAFHTEARDYLILWNIIRQFGVLIGLFVIGMMSLSLPKRVKQGVLLLTLVISMWWAVKPMLTFAPYHVYDHQESEVAKKIKNHVNLDQHRILSLSGYLPYTGLHAYVQDMVQQPPFADSRFTPQERRRFSELIHRQQVLSPNWHLPHLIPTTYGFSTFVLAETAAYWSSDAYGSSINQIDTVAYNDRRISEQGVAAFIADTRTMPRTTGVLRQEYPVLAEGEGWVVFQNTASKPIVVSVNENNQITCSHGFNDINCDISAQEPDEYLFRMPSYPGWHCSTTQGDCNLTPKSLLTQVVSMPSGDHTFTLRFQPWYYPTIIYISAGAWLIYLTLLIMNLRGRMIKK
jgi:hypothetical protein